MTKPGEGKFKLEDAASTPSAEIETGKGWRGKVRLALAFWVSAVIIAVPASALFSWVFSLSEEVTDVEFMDYFGLLAIVLTILGAVVFFYVAFLTAQVSRESRDMRKELDELSEDLREFKSLTGSELKEHRQELTELRQDLDKQSKEIQNLKDQADLEKKPK